MASRLRAATPAPAWLPRPWLPRLWLPRLWLLPLWLLPLWLPSGCGFRPVYGDRADTVSSGAGASLAAISVSLIPERAGQLLRQALQERLERFGAGAPRRYALQASFALSGDAIAVQPDSTITRVRLVGLGSYTLTTLEARRTLTSGTARAVDGLDVLNQQYFAADQQQDAVVRRIAEALADQMALQLAVYFQSHPTLGRAGDPVAVASAGAAPACAGVPGWASGCQATGPGPSAGDRQGAL